MNKIDDDTCSVENLGQINYGHSYSYYTPWYRVLKVRYKLAEAIDHGDQQRLCCLSKLLKTYGRFPWD